MESRCTIRAAVEEQKPQITEQMVRLENAIAHLEDVYIELEQRICMVLRPNTTPCEAKPTAPRQQMAPMAEEIERLTERVNEQLRVSMENLLSRIEL
jgi:hypothetical protein